MNKLITTVVVLLATTFTAFSQVKEVVDVKSDDTTTPVVETEESSGSKKGFTVAATIGYNGYTSQSAQGLSQSYSPKQAYTNWASSTGMVVGIEGGMFVAEDLKLTLELGFAHSIAPGYSELPGTSAPVSQGGIPTYEAVANTATTNYRLFAGVNKYFKMGSSLKLAPYVGGGLGIAHGLSSKNADSVVLQGISVGESLTTNVLTVAGMEYAISPELYFGIQVNPITFNYNVTSIKPSKDIKPLRADVYDYGFLANPTLRIGFKF